MNFQICNNLISERTVGIIMNINENAKTVKPNKKISNVNLMTKLVTSILSVKMILRTCLVPVASPAQHVVCLDK